MEVEQLKVGGGGGGEGGEGAAAGGLGFRDVKELQQRNRELLEVVYARKCTLETRIYMMMHVQYDESSV